MDGAGADRSRRSWRVWKRLIRHYRARLEVPADRARAVKASVQHGADDGIDPLGDSSSARQMKLPAALLMRMSMRPLLEHSVHHPSTCVIFARRSGLRAIVAGELQGAGRVRIACCGSQCHVCAERAEACRHRQSDTGAAAGDDGVFLQ